jgi:prevent-host-death family protein
MPRTISSREFNQDAAGAKRAARAGPVFITDRGRPAHVLMTVEEYRRLSGKGKSIVELLAGAPEVAEFDPPKMGDKMFRPVDFDSD